MNINDLLLQPVLQYGFLGLCLILLGIIVWLIKQLLSVLKKNTDVVSANTAAINTLTTMTADLLVLNRSLHDKIIARPCIVRKDDL